MWEKVEDNVADGGIVSGIQCLPANRSYGISSYSPTDTGRVASLGGASTTRTVSYSTGSRMAAARTLCPNTGPNVEFYSTYVCAQTHQRVWSSEDDTLTRLKLLTSLLQHKDLD